jgi:RNA polymerase sigma-70 factor (ECF subfamily)
VSESVAADREAKLKGPVETRWTLIQAAAAGDAAAQRSFVARYRPAILAFLERRGAGEEAEDLAQEVFLRLFQGTLGRADPERGRFRSLLFTVAQRTLASAAERGGALKRGGGQRPEALGERDVASGAESPEAAFDRAWLERLLGLALERLLAEHPAYHAAIERTFLRGERQAQAAQALGISPQSVKNHVHRGKAKLIAYLQEEVSSYALAADDRAAELDHLATLL